MTPRFQRNIKSLSLIDSTLSKQVVDLTFDPEWIVRRPTGLDIEVDGRSYYTPDAITCCREQLKQYLEQGGKRIFSGWPVRPTDRKTVVTRYWEDGWSYLDNCERAEMPISGGACLIVFGLGSGLFLQTLLENISVRHVFVIEPDIRILRCALELIELSDIISKVENNHGQLKFYVGETGNQIASRLIMDVRIRCNGSMDGSYVYEHSSDECCQFIAGRFRESIDLIFDPIGFFEDECVMMRNFIQNTYKAPGGILRATKNRSTHDLPAFIVGSGPSLDKSVPFLKQFSNHAILFSCGTSLKVLLSHGIVPDFHVEVENDPDIGLILSELSGLYDLSSIVLLASTTVALETSRLFKKRIYYVRESVSSSILFLQMYGEMIAASPTVTNAAARVSITMGVRNVFLFGVDLGARDANRHHSKDTIYYTEQERWDKIERVRNANTFFLKKDANFGGTIWTSPMLVAAALVFEYLISALPHLTFLNCSDGIKINGAIPCPLPELSALFQNPDAHVAEKQQKVQEIINEVEELKIDEQEMEYKLRLLHEAANKVGSDIRSLFKSIEGGAIDFNELHSELDKLLRFPVEEDLVSVDKIAAARTARALFSGSVYTIYAFLYQSIRRLSELDRERVQLSLLERADEAFVEMIEGTNSLIDEVNNEIFQQS